MYSTHVYPTKGPHAGSLPVPDPRAAGSGGPNWQTAFGNLSRSHAVFAGEWGLSEDPRFWVSLLGWGNALADYFDVLQLGWCGWSWVDCPRLRDPANPLWGNLCKRRLCQRGNGGP